MTGSVVGLSAPNTPATARAPKQTGKVAWFNNEKGWGFLTPDSHPDGSKDVFVHWSGLTPQKGKSRRTLQDGASVAFEVVTNAQGKPQAVNVVVTAPPAEVVPI